MAEEHPATTATTKAPASRSGAAPASSSPDEELKKLKEAMEKDQADAEKLKKQMDERKAKLDSLEKALTATNKVSTAFAAAMQGLTAERLEIQDIVANELPQLENQDEVKSRKADIEGIIEQARNRIATQENERGKLDQKHKDEQTALQKAKDDLDRKKAQLDELQNRQRIVLDKFNALRKISQRIKAEGASKPL